MKKAPTKLKITPISKSVSFAGRDYLPEGTQGCGRAVIEITNTGDKPAFHAGIEISNADCRYVCDDNYFMLMPGEKKQVTFEIDRSVQPFYERVKAELIEPVGKELLFTAKAWNASVATAAVAVGE